MTDHETDPQRTPAPADAEPSHPTAELPRTADGQSDSTAPLPRAASGQPDAGGSPAAAPVPADSPAAGTPAPAAADASPTHPDSPYAPPVATPSAPPYQTQQPWYGGQQQGWAHQGGYQPHGGPVPPYQNHQAHQPYPGAQPPQPGQPVPPWGPQPQPVRPSRAGKFVGAGALALALMLGSGVAGGALALAVGGHTTITRTYSAAPVINSADLPKIAASVQDSIVTIMTDSGEGSGVILSADGYVLTNNHVVASASGNTVKVVFADGKTAQAKIIGTDPKTDLGVVKASGVSGLKAAKFGDSDAMQVGDQVLALGSPLGLQGSVTAGILSARDRTIQAGEGGQQQNPQQGGASSISGLLQTDAPINPGNSGGALVNTRGEVIGINTAIATAGQGSNGNIGVGFAIPSNKAKDVAEKLQRGEKISHPSLGVSVSAAEDGGAMIGAVTPGSAAEKAGLQRGDVITKFGDKVINDSNDLVGAVQSGKVGDRVQVEFKRNGSTQTASVTLAETS
ncbi:trypsin-like peptidase domain-containing protein [Micromonospora yasonensis]|uniref:S1C family serine protease n=1 Tax=Micromonospora yasonensis TaxID=1128667 RepID=UPI00222E51FF|nr:trypsin-like peptidase domain-containing protein [Micromonospora yasonensis]MCW3844465.1 trypsin-like peptidase domain-containing protein [Micromonospora yasonensis]